MKITITGEPCEVGAKRCRLPFDLADECPGCGTVREHDVGGEDYLSEPTLNQPLEIDFYCRNCEHEWTRKIVIGITVTEVK